MKVTGIVILAIVVYMASIGVLGYEIQFGTIGLLLFIVAVWIIEELLNPEI